MDYEKTTVEETTEKMGKPTAWSAWSLWHMQPLGPDVWVRHRTQPMRMQTNTTHTVYTCTRQCPYGYQPHGHNCVSVAWIHSPDLSEYSEREYIHFTRVGISVTKSIDYFWNQLEWETRPDNPYLELLRFLHADINVLAEDLETTMSLPPLFEGDSLILDHDIRLKNTKIILDGKERSVRSRLNASDLRVGFHVIDVISENTKAKKRLHIQFSVNILSLVEFKFPPVSKITLDDDKNGGIVKLQLHNHSRGECAIHVEAGAAASGWQAVQLNEPVRILKPDQWVDVYVQLEQMLVAQITTDPIPFFLRVNYPGTSLPATNVTFYVSARDKRTWNRRITPAPH